MSTDNKPQSAFDLPDQNADVKNVHEYKFEPIKGFPMLNWRGKRPFHSTQYFPAQLKEVHGEEVDGWRNKIYWGDNLQVMSHLLKDFRRKVDLIYIDPPFDSKADYKKKIELKGKCTENDITSFEEKQYGDIWTNDGYLQFMFERLVLARELLSASGSLYLHCDWHKSHHLRCIMDEVFGPSRFQNEIQWCYNIGGKGTERWARKHDTILFYSRSEEFYFDGKAAGVKRDTGSKSMGGIIRRDDAGRLYQDKLVKASGKYYRYYLDEPKIPEDWWADINSIQSGSDERTNYPTQKPEALLERIIKASCPPEGIVFDFFMGSGTTQAVAMQCGRKFLGADINLGATQTTTKRLSKVGSELKQQILASDEKYYTGFEVYNVNHYDIFRNPVQAKELLIEALGIQQLDFNSVFDGEKDGRMVKIMPVNRITTRVDLAELTAGFDYKAWERKQNVKPNQPVEKIQLICMGHEPNLSAELELAVKPFKIDVEVVDILREKSNLEFKRDSEAEVTVKNGELVIERFYPMNLLQKLSLQKEAVADWRDMVETIMIDWNFDGAVLQPAIVDMPGKNDLVSGKYKIPKDAGTIRVKITDVLSESWEGEVNGN